MFLYADDIKLYLPIPSHDDINHLQSDIDLYLLIGVTA